MAANVIATSSSGKCVAYDDGTFKLKDVRISYPHIWKLWSKNESDTKKFSATFLLRFEERRADIVMLRNAALKMAGEFYKLAPVKLKSGRVEVPFTAANLFLRDAAGNASEGYEGCWIVKASEKTRPTIVDSNKKPLAEDDGKLLAGDHCNVVIRPWAQKDGQYGKKVNANLLLIQYLREGERLGGSARPDVDEMFEDESAEDDGLSGGGSDGLDDDDGLS